VHRPLSTVGNISWNISLQSRLSFWDVVGHFQLLPSKTFPLPIIPPSFLFTQHGAYGLDWRNHSQTSCMQQLLSRYVIRPPSAKPHRRINIPVYHSRIPAKDLYDPTRRRLQEGNWHKAELTEGMKGALLAASVSGPKFQVHGIACTVVHT
jgi:hypothetical protein